MLTKRALIAAKAESTYNTDATPGATDVVRVENLEVNLAEGARMHERPALRGTLGQLKHVYGGALVGINFDVPIAGSGTAGEAPEFGDLLKAAGLSETVVVDTSVTYEPASSDHDSATIYFYEDGTLYKATGCRGNVSFNGEAGKYGVLSFSMIGHVAGPTDASIISGTFLTTVPPIITSASFTIDSFDAVIAALTWDLQNQTVMPPSVNADDGYADIRIASRDVIGTINPEMELVATEDFIGNWRSGAAMALSMGTIGGTAGNQWDLTMPAVSYREPSRGDRDGVRTLELTFGAAEDTGDDEISLVFE